MDPHDGACLHADPHANPDDDPAVRDRSDATPPPGAAMPGDGRRRTLDALPGEMLHRVLRFLDLEGVARASASCAAVAAIGADELRRERERRDTLLLLWPHSAGLLAPRDAADACRRWGLPSERPFREIARRAGRRWAVETTSPSLRAPDDVPGLPALTLVLDGCRLQGEPCAVSSDRMRCGECLCLCHGGRELLRLPMDIDLKRDHSVYDCWTDAEGRLDIRVPAGVAYRRDSVGAVTRINVRVSVALPRDLDLVVPARGVGPARLTTPLTVPTGYAAPLEGLWGLPPDSVRPVRNPLSGIWSWRIEGAAYDAVLRHYVSHGVPPSGEVDVYVQQALPAAPSAS